jgi:hypothetical protein
MTMQKASMTYTLMDGKSAMTDAITSNPVDSTAVRDREEE